MPADNDRFRQVVDNLLSERGIAAKDGPPAGYFETVSLAGAAPSAERFVYEVVRGAGPTEDVAREEFIAHLRNAIPESAKAAVWRRRPEITAEKDFVNETLVWRAYGRLAFLPDAALLDRINYDLPS